MFQKLFLFSSILFLQVLEVDARSFNSNIPSYSKSRDVLPAIYRDHNQTLYCGCRYLGKSIDLKSCGYKVYKNFKRASRLEWEHIVPAEAFGNSFVEWRTGAPGCVYKNKKYKGRKCARKNSEFSRMEADLYNLYPEIGELNGLRSNFSMAEFGGQKPLPKSKTFGDCRARIEDRKFEPMDQAKGIVARTYLYMNQAYPGRGILSRKNEKLFAAWNKLYPVTPWECLRARRIQEIQKNLNPILAEACALTISPKDADKP